MARKKPKVFVFCAHSDDQIFGPGATLAKYSKEGKKIMTVIFSYGEAALPWLKESVARKIRVEEAKKADKVIGGSGVAFFGLREGNFFEDAEKKNIKSKIQRALLLEKPYKIFTHSPNDPHPDHRAVYKIIMDSIEEIQYNCDVYSFDIWTPFNINSRKFPKMYEDVTSSFSKKVDALRVFESQKASLFALFWSVYVKAVVHGFKIHKKYAERFFKVR